jgi:hypothetical protein
MHLHIEVGTSIVFAEGDTVCVPLKYLLDDFSDAAGLGISARVIPRNPGVILRKATLYRCIEESRPIGGLVDIVLYVLKHPPRRITGVIPLQTGQTNNIVTIQKTQTSDYEQSPTDLELGRALMSMQMPGYVS